MKTMSSMVLVAVLWFYCGSKAEAVLFQDNFESNTTASAAAWPDGSGDFDPDAPADGSWYVLEGFPSDVQVSGYMGGTQPTQAHSGSNYLIAGYHYETYGNWDHGGLAIANLSYGASRVRMDFRVWGEENMHAQIDGKELGFADGNDAFSMVLTGSGEVKWNGTTAMATWTSGVWNHMVVELDLKADVGRVEVNGQSPEIFSASGVETLGSIRFRGDTTVYYDDILIEPLPEILGNLLFRDDFESNAGASTAAWPDGSGDFDPDHAAAGYWWAGETGDPSDVQVSGYVGGGQPSAARSGSNYLIAGFHNEVYGNWDHPGRAIASLASLTSKAKIDFWVWGEANMHAQIVGTELPFGNGNGVFYVVLNGNGSVGWASETETLDATATWTAGTWNHVVIDLDCIAQIAGITINGQPPETFPATYQGGAPTLGSIRFEGDKTPYYDDILVTGPASTYAEWTVRYPMLGSATNYVDDPDADAVNNLLEYALGGRPDSSDGTRAMPTFGTGSDGGTNWLSYIYGRRLGADWQLTYSVVSGLEPGSLTHATEEAGSSPLNGEFETVTNRIPMDAEPDQFMTLEVEINDAPLAARITPPYPPNDGILFVNHSISNRSGHLGHALAEYAPGKILAFYPNCSADNSGHSAVGWMEFKRSEDGGATWSDPQVLQFSKDLFDADEGRSAMAEKAVVTDQGEIVLFYLICDISENALWQPYWEPLHSKSADGGRTWSEPQPVCPKRGRIYDAVYRDGEIRVLHFANDATASWWGTTTNHLFELYVSTDGGDTFFKRSTLPFDTLNRGYGSLGFLEDGSMIAYVYNRTDEYHLDYMTSSDGGTTWSAVNTAFFRRKIRNPQFIAFRGKYFMHGRSGAYGEGKGNMILYMSDDGVNWDDGVYLRKLEAGSGAYSNSIIIGSKNDQTKNRLLIQASHAYEDSRTNVLHWWLD